ncbi:Uncharacterised protein [Mycobacteroides abscessus subsp. abscessus]|nr:Uncharacterised protein [Mycobacteroides abscessus subsp. abscessus]
MKASGKNTRSTAFLPRKSLRLTGWLFWLRRVKSGATVPTGSISETFCSSRERSSPPAAG